MAEDRTKDKRVPRKVYEAELFRLQGELVKMQEWVRRRGPRLVVVFEGRDAAGKGSAIKRVTEFLNSRIARIAALPAPTERRAHRSGTSSATSSSCRRPARSCCSTAAGTTGPASSGSWASAPSRSTSASCASARSSSGCSSRTASCCASTGSRSATPSRSAASPSRLDDPMRRWKLSPMDLESITRWEDYSRAKDEMFVHTDLPEAPWYVVEADDKRRARLNMIAHLLSTVPYDEVDPAGRSPCRTRPPSKGYERPPREHADLRARPRRDPAAEGAEAGPRRPVQGPLGVLPMDVGDGRRHDLMILT